MTTDYTSFEGTGVGHGTGPYEGQKIMFSLVGEVIIEDEIPVRADLVIEGIILSPKG